MTGGPFRNFKRCQTPSSSSSVASYGIEKGNYDWPDAMATGVTTCIPKAAEAGIDRTKEYDVSVTDAADTRPITNLSAITAVYDAMRCADLEKVLEGRDPALRIRINFLFVLLVCWSSSSSTGIGPP